MRAITSAEVARHDVYQLTILLGNQLLVYFKTSVEPSVVVQCGDTKYPNTGITRVITPQGTKPTISYVLVRTSPTLQAPSATTTNVNTTVSSIAPQERVAGLNYLRFLTDHVYPRIKSDNTAKRGYDSRSATWPFSERTEPTKQNLRAHAHLVHGALHAQCAYNMCELRMLHGSKSHSTRNCHDCSKAAKENQLNTSQKSLAFTNSCENCLVVDLAAFSLTLRSRRRGLQHFHWR